MTTHSTLNVIQEVLKRTRGKIGKQLIADSIATTSVTKTAEWLNSRYADRAQQGIYLWRFNQSGNNEVKRITDIDPGTGVASIEGAYTDARTDTDFILSSVAPNKLMDAVFTGYEKMLHRKDVVLTNVPDGDMEDPSADYWDGTLGGSVAVNCTVSKVEAAAGNKVTGDYVLNALATAASGYFRSSMVRCVPGSTLNVHPTFRVETGSWSWRVYDVTHAAYLTDAQAYTGAEFATFFPSAISIPAGCNFWQFEFTGATTNDSMWLDSTPARPPNDRRFVLAEWLDETYKLPFVRRARFLQPIESVSNAYSAPSRQWDGDFENGLHYNVEILRSDANPNMLAFEPNVEGLEGYSGPLYLASRKSWAEISPLVYINDTTEAAFGELMAHVMTAICDLMYLETSDQYWVNERARWETTADAESAARQIIANTPAARFINVSV